MSQNPLVLILDFGTQSVRTTLINKQGEIVYYPKNIRALIFSPKGYAEQYADFYWDNLIACIKKMVKEAKDKLKDVVAMTVTTFRDSAVLLDENNKPLRPVILWLDQRLAKAREKLPLLHRIAFKIVGMMDTLT